MLKNTPLKTFLIIAALFSPPCFAGLSSIEVNMEEYPQKRIVPAGSSSCKEIEKDYIADKYTLLVRSSPSVQSTGQLSIFQKDNDIIFHYFSTSPILNDRVRPSKASPHLMSRKWIESQLQSQEFQMEVLQHILGNSSSYHFARIIAYDDPESSQTDSPKITFKIVYDTLKIGLQEKECKLRPEKFSAIKGKSGKVLQKTQKEFSAFLMRRIFFVPDGYPCATREEYIQFRKDREEAYKRSCQKTALVIEEQMKKGSIPRHLTQQTSQSYIPPYSEELRKLFDGVV